VSLTHFVRSAGGSDLASIGSNGMEPFQLSLNQVNFETYDLSENGAEVEPLHSFSNLVSYDWDLKSAEVDEAPVKAKKVVQSPGVADFHCLTYTVMFVQLSVRNVVYKTSQNCHL